MELISNTFSKSKSGRLFGYKIWVSLDDDNKFIFKILNIDFKYFKKNVFLPNIEMITENYKERKINELIEFKSLDESPKFVLKEDGLTCIYRVNKRFKSRTFNEVFYRKDSAENARNYSRDKAN